MHTLSFVLETQEVSAAPKGSFFNDGAFLPGSFLKTNVIPFVNGIRLSPLVFDALACMGQEDTAGMVDLFACGCGSPDCPGLLEPVQVTVTETSVRWTFPPEPYRLALDEAFRTAQGPLALSFPRQEYLDTLRTLAGDLLDIESERGRPVAVEPYQWPSAPLEPLALRYLEIRSTVLYWSEMNERRELLYGDMVHEELVVPLLYDVTLGLSPVLVAQLRSEQLIGGDLDSEEFEVKQHKLLEDVLLPAFKEDRQNLLAAARQLEWTRVEQAAYATKEPASVSEGDDWRALPLALLQLAWSTAPMSLRVLPESGR
jgi:hypothetical protein